MTITQRQLTKWRQELHQIAEPAFTEFKTAKYLANELTNLGLKVKTDIGGTGLLASIKKGTSTKSIGIRADIDGLPIPEETGKSYTSLNSGSMHACGHDGHMTMALGAAAKLISDDSIDGIVNFIFQPAEEPGLGAKAMLADNLFKEFPTDEIYGIHNLPGLPEGHLVTRGGPIMASEDNFIIKIIGLGGHASAPQRVIDPIVISAEIITALQTIVGRNVDPLKSAVISCTEIFTDGARNAIPNSVTIKGDTRTFDNDVRELVESRMRELVTGICQAHNAKVEFQYTHEFEPSVNDVNCAISAHASAINVVGEQKSSGDCAPITASEDFGVFTKEILGCFVFLGVGEAHTPLHNRHYDFNDKVLEIGVNFYVDLVKSKLGKK